jgi:hypothetical protein
MVPFPYSYFDSVTSIGLTLPLRANQKIAQGMPNDRFVGRGCRMSQAQYWAIVRNSEIGLSVIIFQPFSNGIQDSWSVGNIDNRPSPIVASERKAKRIIPEDQRAVRRYDDRVVQAEAVQ